METEQNKKHKCGLVLTRLSSTEFSTMGRLAVIVGDPESELFGVRNDTIFSCDALEPPWRNNEPNKSCVPPGRYDAFGETQGRWIDEYRRIHGDEWIVELLGVKGRSQIQIHVGNKASHTAGCILVGKATGRRDWVGSSGDTYRAFYKAMADAGVVPSEILIIDAF